MTTSNKYLVAIVVALIAVVFILIFGSGSGSEPSKDKVVKAPSPKVTSDRFYELSYNAALVRRGAWNLRYSGETVHDFRVFKTVGILPGEVFAHADCFIHHEKEEKLKNQLIDFQLNSQIDDSDIETLMLEKFEAQKKKSACVIKNPTSRTVDFEYSHERGQKAISGDVIGVFIDRSEYKQWFEIEFNISNEIDALALVEGRPIAIETNRVLVNSEIKYLRRSDDGSHIAVFEPIETDFRERQVFHEKSIEVHIGKRFQMGLAEFDRFSKTSVANVEVIR